MTIDNYNEYIKNYILNDKTNTSIMLTAAWGSGKSYYINNGLKKHLEENGIRCCIVSLYGLNDIKEISKAIYLELRTKNLKNEAAIGTFIAGKAILKGIAGFFNVNIDKNEEDLQRLYESINLNNVLVILEDIERSGIEIKQILGFVNNLTENDGVKVLLVVNEKEIIRYQDKEIEDKEGNIKVIREYTKETLEYFKIKEKTVSDTICYICDFSKSIDQILKSFEIDGGWTNDVLLLMRELEIYNLRSLIYGCQKYVDLIKECKNIDISFKKDVFLSIIAFSIRKKNNNQIAWQKDMSTTNLGTSKYPPYKFAYDFIEYQQINAEEILMEEKNYILRNSDKEKSKKINDILSVIYDYYVKTQKDVETAIKNLKICLLNNEVPTTEYGRIANYLISLKDCVDLPTDIDECKKHMLNNAKMISGDLDQIKSSLKYHFEIEISNVDFKKEYNEFMKELMSTIEMNRYNLKFNYTSTDVDKLHERLIDDGDFFMKKRKFFCDYDVEKFCTMIVDLDADKIEKVRRIFNTVYSFTNINEVYSVDKENLIALKNGIEMIIREDKYKDKIIKRQLQWFIINLDNYISRL